MWQCATFLRMPGLPRASKIAAATLILALTGQICIGVKTIWDGVPIPLASAHQIGAMTVLSAFLFAMHTCRGVDARHLKNLFGKMRVENPAAFNNMSKQYNQTKLSQE